MSKTILSPTSVWPPRPAPRGARAVPEPPERHLARGLEALALFDVEGFEAAAGHFRSADAAEPGFPPAWAGLAQAYSYWAFRREIVGGAEEGRALYELSFECAQRALRGAPELADAQRAMAAALARGPRADAEERRRRAEAAVELGPGDAWNWHELWRAAGRPLGHPSLSRCLELAPRHCGIRIDHGAALCEDGRLCEAARELTLALSLAPRNVLVHYDLAMVLCRLGRAAKGREVLERGLAIHPADPLLLRGIGWVGGDSRA